MVGQILAHYRITERLGAGGMAVVWKAVDEELGREVALKVLPPDDSGDPARVQRFLREARCASALNHPNIVTIYEANTAADTPYISMEYVRGVTLSRRLREEPLGVAACIDIARQICSALSHAHAAGIVHRDLKPGNIMLTGGVVKVLDFGIAKRIASAAAVDATITSVTAVGTTVGTISYMSPEQALGDEVDARSDLFSLGVVLYEMLSRQRPFDAKTTVTALRNLVYNDPRPLRELAPEVPPQLERIVERCLAKDREHRYQSAAGVSEALRQVAISTTDGGTVTVATLPAGKPPASRKMVKVAAASVVCLGLVAGGWRYTRDGNTSSAATESAGTVTYKTEYDATKAARTYLDRYDRKGNIDRALEAVEAALRMNPEYALGYALHSEAYLRRHIVTPDNQWLKMAADSARKAVSLNADLGAAHSALGDVLAAQGDHKGALAAFKRATDLDPANSRAVLGLAKATAASGDAPAAEALFQ